MAMLKYLPVNAGFMPPEDDTHIPPQAAKVLIIPFGLEKTVSYEGGTDKGPQAVIDASPQLEYFDEDLWCEAIKKYGIATLEAPKIADKLEDALDQLAGLVEEALAANKFPMTVGGEHSLTPGAIRPFVERAKAAGETLTILQFDAHADLRNGYEGEHYSHAAAMRRCLDHDNVRLVSVGIRNISAEEIPFYEGNKDRIKIFWARDKYALSREDIVKAVGTGPVYITFDVDGLDASLMPATGTPEPGGLFWNDTMTFIEAVGKHCNVVGADVVELAPRAGLHACDFLTAKLIYKILNFALVKTKHSD